jgi:hypothetical protein
VRCTKELFLVGSRTFSAEQCIAKAATDADCSGVVQQMPGNQGFCECWLKHSCCGECKPVDFWQSAYDTTVYATKEPAAADLNCATGVRSSDDAHCCPASCGSKCLPRPLFQVSFQSPAQQAPLGWAKDSGATFGVRTNDYPQPGFDTYGWNCTNALGADAFDREPDDDPDYHSSSIRANRMTCGGLPKWEVAIANGNYEVHVLHSIAYRRYSDCELEGVANTGGDTSLDDDDMLWLFKTVNVLDGRLTWSGASDNDCEGIAALRIYALEGTVSDCRRLPGVCCPQFVSMAERPCTLFAPPCSL